MVQLNLLPDSKSKVNKSRMQQRLFFSVAFISIVLTGLIATLLALRVYGLQRSRVNELDEGIAAAQARIEGVQDLDRMVTIVGNNDSVGSLLDERPEFQRLRGFLDQMLPSNVIVQGMRMDITGVNNSALTQFQPGVFRSSGDTYDIVITMNGTTNTQKSLNTLIDTLKFADYSYTTDDAARSEPKRVFSEVVNTSWSIASDPQAENQSVNFTIDAKMDVTLYNPLLSDVSIQIPQITSSPSSVENPCIFDQSCEAQ